MPLELTQWPLFEPLLIDLGEPLPRLYALMISAVPFFPITSMLLPFFIVVSNLNVNKKPRDNLLITWIYRR